MIVPPRGRMPETSCGPSSSKRPSTSPRQPSTTATQSQPSASELRTTARMTALRPGQSPPPVRMPMVRAIALVLPVAGNDGAAVAEDAQDVRVELAPPCQRHEGAHGPDGVVRVGEEDEVRTGANRLRRPALDGSVVHERERVRDRDTAEAERAKQAVGARLERRAEARAVEGFVDHHAADARVYGRAERPEILRPDG